MYQKQVLVQNQIGLHARPAGDFARLAATYSSTISIGRVGEKKVNAKSILLVLTLGITQGTTVEIQAEGADEQKAVDALVAFLEELI